MQTCINGSVRMVSWIIMYYAKYNQSLQSTESLSYGAVEACVNGKWGSICSDHWDNNDASVVSRQLGYSPYGEF